MNKGIKEQLENLWCQNVKPLDTQCSCVNFMNRGNVVTCNCDVQEPVLKPTDLALNASNDVNPTSDRLKCDEGLKLE